MKYSSQQKPLSLDLFRSSFDDLSKSNRWVALADLLPWDEIKKTYNSRLDNKHKSAGNKPARMIIGACIIKHYFNLSDQETIDMIQENPYMQYLCGLSDFTDKPIFDASLFVTIRKRISMEEIKTYCKPLEGPSKESKILEFIAKMTKAIGERNEIECSFGTGKRIYRANNIRAKFPENSECWKGMCYFVKNVMKFLRELCLVLSEIWLIFAVEHFEERKVRCALRVVKY